MLYLVIVKEVEEPLSALRGWFKPDGFLLQKLQTMPVSEKSIFFNIYLFFFFSKNITLDMFEIINVDKVEDTE